MNNLIGQTMIIKHRGVAIPKSISTVTVRAYDSVHGYGGKTITFQLPH